MSRLQPHAPDSRVPYPAGIGAAESRMRHRLDDWSNQACSASHICFALWRMPCCYQPAICPFAQHARLCTVRLRWGVCWVLGGGVPRERGGGGGQMRPLRLVLGVLGMHPSAMNHPAGLEAAIMGDKFAAIADATGGFPRCMAWFFGSNQQWD